MRIGLLFIVLSCFIQVTGQEKIYAWDDVTLKTSSNDRSPFLNTIARKESNEFITTIVHKKGILRFRTQNNKVQPLLNHYVSREANTDDFLYNIPLSQKQLAFYRKSQYIGGVFTNNNITEVLRDRANFRFLILETNMETGQSMFTDTINSKGIETVIHSFNQKNILYFLTYTSGTNELNIYSKMPGKRFKKDQLIISLENSGKVSTGFLAPDLKKFSDFFRTKRFGIYYNDQRYPLTLTSIKNKIYIQDGKLVFTVNSTNLKTHAIVVDLEKMSYHKKSFQQDQEDPGNKTEASTSLLLNSDLITTHVKGKVLKLSFFDLNSEEKKDELILDESNIHQYAQNTMQKTGSFFSRSDVMPTTIDQFCDIATRNSISLSGYTESGKLFLNFGAPYDQVINATQLLNLIMTVAGTYMINAPSDTYGFFLAAYSGANGATYHGFQTALRPNNLTPLPEQANHSVWDQMDAFYVINQMHMKKASFFYMNGFYYISYYNSNTDKFLIHRFDERGTE